MPPQSSHNLLTMEQVAVELQVSVRTISKYLQANAFPNAFKTTDAKNGSWRIPNKDLQRFIKARRQDRKQKRNQAVT